jgi:hypothetical protein
MAPRILTTEWRPEADSSSASCARCTALLLLALEERRSMAQATAACSASRCSKAVMGAMTLLTSSGVPPSAPWLPLLEPMQAAAMLPNIVGWPGPPRSPPSHVREGGRIRRCARPA